MLSFIIKKSFPFIPGLDISGVVTAVGAAVKRFAVGDRVFGDLTVTQGGLAEYAVAHEDNLVKLPDSVAHWQGAALPVAALTAYQGLQHAGVAMGTRVLILGGAGGVGSFAVQIAKLLGATVLSTTSTRNLPLVRVLGADHVFDHTAATGSRWWEVLANEQVDAVFDTVGELNSWEHGKLVLRSSGGVFVQIAMQEASDSVGKFVCLSLGRKISSWFGSHRYLTFRTDDGAKAVTENLGKCVDWVANGHMKIVVNSVYALDEKAAVGIFQELEQGHARGKLLLQIVKEDIAKEAFADAMSAGAVTHPWDSVSVAATAPATPSHA